MSYLLLMGMGDANVKNISTSKPVKIEADEIIIKRDNDQVVFVGKVKITQDELNIFSDNMIVNYYKNKDKSVSIKNIKANNNVILKNKTITAKGDSAVYDFRNQLITLKDNIILNEEDAVVLGDVLTYNVETQETKMGSKEDEENIENTENIKSIEDSAGENEGNKNKKRVIIILDNINDLKDRYDK